MAMYLSEIDIYGTEIEIFEMNVDDFYDFAERSVSLQKYTDLRVVFHSQTGATYIAASSPGKFYWLEPAYIPMFEDGKYIGIGRAEENHEMYCWDKDGLTHFSEPDLSKMGIVAQIKVTGSPKRWKHTGKTGVKE